LWTRLDGSPAGRSARSKPSLPRRQPPPPGLTPPTRPPPRTAAAAPPGPPPASPPGTPGPPLRPPPGPPLRPPPGPPSPGPPPGTPTGMPPKPPGTPPGTLCTGGSVPTSKAHPSHPSNPSTERRPQVSDREAFGGGCEGAEMTRVDRLRADGWTECGTCGGSGKVDSSCSDQCDYEVACPDCVDGRVPPDGMVEAAARWAHAEMGRRSG